MLGIQPMQTWGICTKNKLGLKFLILLPSYSSLGHSLLTNFLLMNEVLPGFFQLLPAELFFSFLLLYSIFQDNTSHNIEFTILMYTF